MKVYEKAKELGLESKDLIAILDKMGVEVKSHMSVLEDDQIKAVDNYMKPSKAPAPAPAPAKPAAAPATAAQTSAPAKSAEPVKKKKKNPKIRASFLLVTLTIPKCRVLRSQRIL